MVNYCKNCGEKWKQNVRFCSNCGKEFEVVDSQMKIIQDKTIENDADKSSAVLSSINVGESMPEKQERKWDIKNKKKFAVFGIIAVIVGLGLGYFVTQNSIKKPTTTNSVAPQFKDGILGTEDRANMSYIKYNLNGQVKELGFVTNGRGSIELKDLDEDGIREIIVPTELYSDQNSMVSKNDIPLWYNIYHLDTKNGVAIFVSSQFADYYEKIVLGSQYKKTRNISKTANNPTLFLLNNAMCSLIEEIAQKKFIPSDDTQVAKKYQQILNKNSGENGINTTPEVRQTTQSQALIDNNKGNSGAVVNIPDAVFESIIRRAINKSSGAIYQSDVLRVTELKIVSQIDDVDIRGIGNFTNLSTLYIHNIRTNIRYMKELEKISSLKVLYLSGNAMSEDDIRILIPQTYRRANIRYINI